MNDIDLIKSMLRAQSWEIIKGNFNSILKTYDSGSEDFHKMKESVINFIDYIEYNGLDK